MHIDTFYLVTFYATICRGKVPYCTSCATFLQALRGKAAQLVQYGTLSLRNIGFLEGAHPIAAEFKWHNWYSTVLFLYTLIATPDASNTCSRQLSSG